MTIQEISIRVKKSKSTITIDAPNLMSALQIVQGLDLERQDYEIVPNNESFIIKIRRWI